MNNNPIISLKNITKTFKGLDAPVLSNLNLQLNKSENIAISGVSGSGKSTLLHLMAGLDYPNSGSVHLNNENIGSLSQNDLSIIRNQLIGFIYQSHHLLPDFSALENVVMPLLIRGGKYQSNHNKAIKILKKLGLSNRLDHYPHQLSGGERQRVAIGRALINEPQIILADEPTGNLDRSNAKVVFDLFINLAKEYGSSIVLVTHDPELARKMKKIYHLSAGKLRSR
jgi:lipoprotein-releasing system ATP-binding protein|tara:strand:+ start:211 stop:888 length:678 start_codon:yes stop_codon:yes gene_type:complete